MRRAAAIALAAWGLWLCPAPPAAAAGPELAEFDRAVAEARRALAQKEAAGVLEALGRATAAAWRRLPFTAVEVHLVAAPPEGFGEYLPRVDNVYRPSEPLILYLEPVGFAVTRDADEGVYRHNLAADFNLVDAWGHVVSGRRRFGRFQGETRHFPDRLPLTFTYSLSGLPPGEYRLETILRDLLGEKTHTVVTPIRIESP